MYRFWAASIVIVSLLLSDSIILTAQTKNFIGSVTYSIKEFDGDGRERLTPVTAEKYFFGESAVLNKVLSGSQLFLIGNVDICMDISSHSIFKINHEERIVKNISGTIQSEEITPINEYTLESTFVSKQKCNVNFLTYAHKLLMPTDKSIDTLSCTFYHSQRFDIPYKKQLAKLQGNRNTLFLDGRYQGLPLKVVLIRQDSSKIVIEAIDIKEMSVEEYVKIPGYPTH